MDIENGMIGSFSNKNGVYWFLFKVLKNFNFDEIKEISITKLKNETEESFFDYEIYDEMYAYLYQNGYIQHMEYDNRISIDFVFCDIV